jgi:phosphatidylserine decarboxylase
MTHPDRYGAWSTLLPPIHPDGRPFIAVAVNVTVVLFVALQPLGGVALIATLWVAAFFQDLWRVSRQSPGLALASADEETVTVDREAPPSEPDTGAQPMLRIEILLRLIDVRINRTPMAGRVTRIGYRRGVFRDAGETAAGSENERNAITLDTAKGAVGLVQIAARMARRVRCDLVEGQRAVAGETALAAVPGTVPSPRESFVTQ